MEYKSNSSSKKDWGALKTLVNLALAFGAIFTPVVLSTEADYFHWSGPVTFLISTPVIIVSLLWWFSGSFPLKPKPHKKLFITPLSWGKLVLVAGWLAFLFSEFSYVDDILERWEKSSKIMHKELLLDYSLNVGEIYKRYPDIPAELNQVCDNGFSIRGKANRTGLHLACIPTSTIDSVREIAYSEHRNLICMKGVIFQPLEVKIVNVAKLSYRCYRKDAVFPTYASLKSK